MKCFTLSDIFVYMDICWASHLEMSPKCFTMATIVLSFLHLRSSCMWHWLSTQCILNIHLPSYSTVWLLHGWCHLKLLPSRCKFCARHRTMHQFPMSPYLKSHICRMHVCLAVTCRLCFWQNDHDLLRATAVTWGWNEYRHKSWYRQLTLEKKILLLPLPGLEPKTFRSWVCNSTTESSLLPDIL